MARLTVLQQTLLLGMLTILLVVQTPLSGYAEESSTKSKQVPIPELELIKEEETVSIASRYEQPISQAPSNVYVITDEDIRQSGATDIPTVLRRVPGLDIMQVTGADFNVSARGDNQLFSNKMLVMVDGRSIYIDGQGLVFWKSLPVTLPEIKRIEVLKGPASVVYGFNAFDGVINIITKSAQELRGTTLQSGGGELGTLSSAAIHAGTVGQLDYRLSAGRDQNQQWRDRDALAFRSHKFNAQTQYNFSNDGTLRIAGGFIDTNRFDGPVSNLQIPHLQFNQGFSDIHYQYHSFSIRGWWQGNDIPVDAAAHPLFGQLIRLTNARTGNDLSFRTQTYNVESQHSLALSSTNTLTYGVNYRYNSVDGSAVSQFGREDRLGFHMQDEWKLHPALTAIAGIRYDLHSHINGTWSPRVALIYALTPNHTFRVSGSVAYRPPTIFEANLAVRLLSTTPQPVVVIEGSPQLSPEQIISYEVGYQGWWWNHRLRTRLDVFYNHLSDLINFQQSNGTTRALINGGNADIYGTEGGVEILLSSWLSGFANISYQKVRQTFTGEFRRGAPDFKANVGVRGEWDTGLSAESSINYVEGATYPLLNSASSLGSLLPTQTVDSYSLLHLRGAYKFWQEKAEAGYMRDAEVALSAYNSLNDEHKEHPLGDTIGSRVMGWITVRY